MRQNSQLTHNGGMPKRRHVGKLVTVKWTTRSGKVRRIRLYEAWRNLIGRTRGGKSQNKEKPWLGKPIEFKNWREFRSWSIAHGYRRGMQLDRIESTQGYSPTNCQWIPAEEHSAKSFASHRADCPCPVCQRSLASVNDEIYDY